MKRNDVRILFSLIIILLLLVSCAQTAESKLKSWIGEYNFEQYSPPNISLRYTVTVCEEAGSSSYYARVMVDGFQSMQRLKAKVVLKQETQIDIVFEEYLPNNIGEPFAAGDVLLSLREKDGVIETKWEKLIPLLNVTSTDEGWTESFERHEKEDKGAVLLS